MNENNLEQDIRELGSAPGARIAVPGKWTIIRNDDGTVLVDFKGDS